MKTECSSKSGQATDRKRESESVEGEWRERKGERGRERRRAGGGVNKMQ